MRILAGRHAGRHLAQVADPRMRPTAEHVRGAILDHLAPHLPKARVLDLFAGTGALGLEALSRGARYCDFVEFRPGSLHTLKANIALLGVKERTRVFKKDAVPFAAKLGPGSYDIVFLDPPYESKVLDRVFEMWKAHPFSQVLVAEHAAGHPMPGGVKRFKFVETNVTVYEAPTPLPRAPTADVRPDRMRS
jgi:16S rRNA (guanine966-N2)-methyltransferase